MNKIFHSPLALLFLLAFSHPAYSQDVGRVSPATVLLPLPGLIPMPPETLREHDPWNLPMTGPWRFQLTHGQMIAGHFAPPLSQMTAGVTASSTQGENPPQDAFDGSTETRWCAADGTFPQSLQADLGQTKHVTGITLAWETPGGGYLCRVEGSTDGAQWQTLADATSAPGIGDGPVTMAPTDVRYVRISITGTRAGWASLREFQIHYAQGNQDMVWKPEVSDAPPPHADDFTKPSYDDKGWHTLSVPSNWEMAGYSLPTYNSVDDTVGLYRRWVIVPASYTGHRVFWHFDGALDGAQVYVNGHYAGYHESGYTAFDVDLTGLVRPGRRNLFAVRVCKMTPSVDCETGDFQCMGGIYRDTSLIAVPMTGVHDITVTTPLTDNYHDANLLADVQMLGTPGAHVGLTGALYESNGNTTPVRLSGSGKLGTDGTGTISLSAFVKSPRLWSAEKPNLYYLVVQVSQNGKPMERIQQRFGFREVEIKNDIVLWNGRPIKCTGMCRHDFWGNKGFALTDTQWLRDIELMKAANINAIRTSHYPDAARFMELCDEKGFYVMDEVPFCWINGKINDPSFAPALLHRARETIARDKNRACVLAWSVGNENGVGSNSQKVIDLVKTLDPTRPRFISTAGLWGGLTDQSFADRHYPSPSDVDNYISHDTAKLPAVFTEQPHTFYEKEAHEYDPGVSDLWSEALIRTWDKLWKAPTILGSFVWEWQNQGIEDPNADRTTDFYYSPNYLRQENNKGIVTTLRMPKSEYWIVKMVYSPVVVETRTVTPTHGICTVALTNHYSFTDLKELTCRWTALDENNKALQSGIRHIACGPMQSVMATFPSSRGMTALRLVFDHADGSNITIAHLSVLGAPSPTPPAGPTGADALTAQEGTETLTVSNSLQTLVFDKSTGSIQDWRVGGHTLLSGGPVLNLGQGMTGTWKNYLSLAEAPILTNVTITQGMSMVTVGDGMVTVNVSGTVRPSAGGTPLGTLTCRYLIHKNATMDVSWTLNWASADTHLWEVGMKFPMPSAYSQMRWWRDSFFTAYPAGHLGEPTGMCRSGDTQFEASKRDLHWMTLTDPTGNGLELLSDGSPLVARAIPGAQENTLFASTQLAGPQGLSGDWVSDHDILATQGQSLSGSFVLRATATNVQKHSGNTK
jgi:beta-galactosidase